MAKNLINIDKDPLAPDLLHKMNAYWRAANYLSVVCRLRAHPGHIKCRSW